jgi:hypothetical protein
MANTLKMVGRKDGGILEYLNKWLTAYVLTFFFLCSSVV